MKYQFYILVPIGLYVVDTCLLLLLPLVANPPYDLSYTIVGDLLRTIILISGALSFFILTVLYMRVYLKNKNQLRLFVVLSIIFFEIAFITESVNSNFDLTDPILDRFQLDSSVLPVALALFYFLSAGYTLLILGDQKRKPWFMTILLSITVVSLSCHVIDLILKIGFRNTSIPTFRSLMLLLIYVVIFIIFIAFFVLAVKVFKLVQKTSSPSTKQGLRAIGASFLLFASFVLLLLLGDLAEDLGDMMNISAIICGVIAFYFIYNGFIRPSQMKKEEIV